MRHNLVISGDRLPRREFLPFFFFLNIYHGAIHYTPYGITKTREHRRHYRNTAFLLDEKSRFVVFLYAYESIRYGSRTGGSPTSI